jgi:hypothetical protein
MPIDFESWQNMTAEQQAQFWAGLRAIEARRAETARISKENRREIAKLIVEKTRTSTAVVCSQ